MKYFSKSAAWYGIYFMVLTAPLLQGLFFFYSIFLMDACLIVILIYAIKNNKGFYIDTGPMLWILISIAGMYCISTFYAIDSGMAVFGSLKWVGYVVFYLVLLQLKEREKLIRAIPISGIVSAGIGLIGTFIPEFSTYVLQHGRLGSCIQYANTFGLWMLMSIVLIERKNSNPWIERGILLGALLLTFSRSSYIFALIIFGWLLIVEPKKYIIRSIFIGVVIFSIWNGLVHNLDILRIRDISMETNTWQLRLLYDRDAINIIKDHLWGLGYWGYYYVQTEYQSGYYWIKYVHNQILQIGLDIGVIGIILYISLFLKYFYTAYWSDNKKYSIVVAIIGIYSLIDFHMEFSMIVFALLLGISLQAKVKRIKISPIIAKGFDVLLCCVALIFIWLGVADGLHYLHKDREAISLVPFYTEAKVDYMDKLNDYDLYKRELAEEILAQNNYVIQVYHTLAVQYDEVGDYAAALKNIKKLLEIDPLNIHHVELYSEILLHQLEYSVNIKDDTLAVKTYSKIEDIDQYIRKQKRRISRRAYKLEKVPTMVMTKTLLDQQILAEKILDNIRG